VEEVGVEDIVSRSSVGGLGVYGRMLGGEAIRMVSAGSPRMEGDDGEMKGLPNEDKEVDEE